MNKEVKKLISESDEENWVEYYQRHCISPFHSYQESPKRNNMKIILENSRNNDCSRLHFYMLLIATLRPFIVTVNRFSGFLIFNN